MPILQAYTAQQSRFDKAFCGDGWCCSAVCEACGRTYFVTSIGHGEKADQEPDRYIEVPDFSYVTTVWVNRKQLVIGCVCDPTKAWSQWIENHAEALTEYLRLYWQDRQKQAKHDTEMAESALAALDEAAPAPI
ncbi:MAG: hypothetical protein ACYTEX_28390 [Planctomycetota bacterium]|jgi:hypothetical protein